MGEMIGNHLPCPCGKSSDGYTQYDDGGWCHPCGTAFKDGVRMEKQERAETPVVDVDITDLFNRFEAIAERGLTKQACEKFKVGVNHGPEPWKWIFPYFSKDGKRHRGNKLRMKYRDDLTEKENHKRRFLWEGPKDDDLGMFGQQLFPAPPNGKGTITITEGEIDAVSAWIMSGSRYPVVSVRSTGQAVKDVKSNFEYLNSFGEIVLCFDADEEHINPRTGEITFPGQEAAEKVAKMFEIGKVRVLTLKEGKDANDYLVAGKHEQFVREWHQAPRYIPGGLKLGKDMWDDIANYKSSFAVDYPWIGLNRMTYGIRLSEAVLLQADTGIGKTSICKEIEYALLTNQLLVEKGSGVGFLHFEEPNRDTALGMLSIHNNKPYHLPDVEREPNELRGAYDAVLNNDRVVIWDHFGSNDVDEVLAKIRHMHNLGCKYIFIDHLSIVVSDHSGDERKQLDEISTKLKMMTMELEIAVIAVIHTNRQGGVRGSAGPEQLANIHMALYRDKEDKDPWRRNVTKIVIKKNRFCGRTGPACYLWYNEETGRLVELTPEQIARFESGEAVREDEMW